MLADYQAQFKTFRQQIFSGLSASQPSIPTPFLFAIERRTLSFENKSVIQKSFGTRFNLSDEDSGIPAGSELFNEILQTPEYYTDDDELILIDQLKETDLYVEIEAPFIVTELGPGNGDKSHLFLSKIKSASFSYQAIDISRDFLEVTKAKVDKLTYCNDVKTLEGDFFDTVRFNEANFEKADILLMMGNTFGNFAPSKSKKLLHHIKENMLQEDGLVIIGLDSSHDSCALQGAYDDKQNRTSTFALNALVSMRHDFGMQVDFEAYDYQARFISEQEMMQMGLKVKADTKISDISGEVRFREGDFIEVGRSYKYSKHSLTKLFKENNLAMISAISSQRGMSLYKFRNKGV